MAFYCEGYPEAILSVQAATMPELINYLDLLWGSDGVKDINDIEEVREEALRQTKEHYTDKSSEEYESVSFWKKVMNAKQ